ncbi:uncharacterized mitochondrial protein AtMg00810-like [Zingiber officinale]|uniref:uncharacterized mitochondrial protein AtMg00810-like n=1 Tax=Zingiber officinale TaxID=94328 RepID=UPI001C4CB989|nr:uncharacterized mitochondrial protein AtMg00810-like [Zingiber officinale]
MVIILLYVDDIILTSSNYAKVTSLQEELSLRFDMKKLRELINFLGLQIKNLDKGIFVSQFSYAKRLVKKFGLIAGKKRSTPLDGVEFSLQGFANVDFGGDLDDQRSTSDFIFLCGATSVSWCSKKQGLVSQSITEAEYKASVHAAQECMWLRRLFENLHMPIDQPIPIQGDNLSAIKLTSNSIFHARTKHIELDHYFIREKVLEGIIDMIAVKSEDNVADIFTKSLPKGAFEDLQSKLGLVLRTSV